MGSAHTTSPQTSDLAGNPRWELVLRTVASPAFQKSARLRDFLLYVGEAAVRGKTDDLTEHHIGCAVFGRKPTYSPADDNTVRVHARQLRFRLEEHFRGDGRDEPMVIDIPKGSYVPVFMPREAPATTAASRDRWWYPWALCGALAVVCGVLAYQNWQSRETGGGGRGEAGPSALLSAVCEVGKTTTVVVPDSGFGTIQSILGKKLSLEDYLNPGYPEVLTKDLPGAREQRWFRGLAQRPYTTFAILLAVSRLSRLAERHHWNLSYRFSRDVRVRDLNEGNVILLGSAMSNPWVSLYEKDLNFRSGWDEALGVPLFENAAPRQGELRNYSASDRNGIPGAAYAVVSLVTDSKSGGNRGSRVLILEGVNMEGTEAAVEFACDPNRVVEALHMKPGEMAAVGAPGRLEILLRTKAMAGAARGTEVVAIRSSQAH